MALPNQLNLTRVQNPASNWPTQETALEQCLGDILGIGVTTVNDSLLAIDAAGLHINKLIRLGNTTAAGGGGARFRDTTTNKEYRLVASGSSINLDFNTGTDAAPTWSTIMSFPISVGIDACRTRMSGVQNIAGNNTFVSIQFAGADDIDTNTLHDTAVNNTRITIPTGSAGLYQVTGGLLFPTVPPAAAVQVRLLVSGATMWGLKQEAVGVNGQAIQVSALIPMAIADYVELQGGWVSGPANSNVGGTTRESFLSAVKVGHNPVNTVT